MSLSTEKDGDSTGRAVLLEDVDGVGDEGGGIRVNEDEVKARVGPGEGSDEETRDGVASEDSDNGDDNRGSSSERRHLDKNQMQTIPGSSRSGAGLRYGTTPTY